MSAATTSDFIVISHGSIVILYALRCSSGLGRRVSAR